MATSLLVVPAGNLTINPTLMPNFPFDIEKDFVPVTMLAKAPNVLVASPSSGIKSAKELVAMAKAKPGTLSYASPGVGSGLHLAGELFKQQAGIDLLHVPYKGTPPALNDVLGGSVPLMFSNLPATMPFIKNGKLIALGITEAKRSAAVPDIPTLAEPGYPGRDRDLVVWPPGAQGHTARRGRATREGCGADAGCARCARAPQGTGHDRRGDETAVWAKIIKARNIVAE